MAKEIIELEVKTGKSKKEIEELKKSLEESVAKFEEMSSKSKDFEKNVDNMKTDKLSSIKGYLGGAVDGFKSLKVAIISSGIGAIVLGIVGAFKFLQEAIGRSEKASESFGKIMSYISGVFNGLIAVITPVVELLGDALVKAIESPSEAWNSFVNNLERGWKFVKGQIVDRFLASWTLLAGNFEKGVLKMRIAWNEFTGDAEEAEELKSQLKQVNKDLKDATQTLIHRNKEIKDGFDSAVDSVKNFGKEAFSSYNKASEASEKLANSERRLVKNRIAMEKQQLESLRLAEEQRQIRDDISLSIEERIKANTKLGEILDEQLQRELSLAQQQLNIALLQKQSTGDTIENIEAVGEAELKILEIRERITGQKYEQLVNEQALLKEQEDLANEKEKKEEEKEKEKIAKQEETTRQKEEAIKKIVDEYKKAKEEEEAETEVEKLELQKKRQLARLELLMQGLDQESEAYKLAVKQREDYVLASDEAIQNAKEADAKAEINREKLLQNQKIAMAGRTFGQLAQLLGENTKAGKTAGIANALINTYQGISNVWAEKAESDLVGAGFIQRVATTALVALQGFKAVKNISKVNPSVKSSNPSGGSTGGSASPPPRQANFNIVGGSPINQLAQSIGEQTNQPQQAYVVSGEVTTAQDLEESIIDSASIGG